MADKLSQDRIAKLQDAFAMFDTNQDGFLNILEVKDVLISIGISPTDDDVRRAINATDLDGDKSINFPEFLNLVAKDPSLWEEDTDSEMRQLFKLFDRDRDGYLTHDEIKRAMEQTGETMTHVEVEDMIKDADTDGDGKLTFEEFEAVMIKCHGQTSN